jgi:hypothetical protein
MPLKVLPLHFSFSTGNQVDHELAAIFGRSPLLRNAKETDRYAQNGMDVQQKAAHHRHILVAHGSAGFEIVA